MATRARTLMALGLSSLLLTACDLDTVTGLFGDPVIKTSDVISFHSSYEKVLNSLADEDPAGAITIRKEERIYGVIAGFDLDNLDLSSTPPELAFDAPSVREARSLLFQNVGARMEGMDGYGLNSIFRREKQSFISAYAARVDEEIAAIDQEIAAMDEAYARIAPVTDNLFFTRMHYSPNGQSIVLHGDFVNGAPQEIFGAQMRLELPGQTFERTVEFDEGLAVGKRLRSQITLDGLHEAPGDDPDYDILAVKLANGSWITAREAHKALLLLEERKRVFAQFREDLEKKLEEALNGAA